MWFIEWEYQQLILYKILFHQKQRYQIVSYDS